MQKAETACFLTVTRADLIDMTQRLMAGVESGFFHEADRPLLISMTGSFQSGKSLVVDTTCDLLCGDKQLVDLNCITVRWQGRHEGQPINISMMDMSGWNPHEYRTQRQQKIGGINFIQNAPHLNNEADIAICIEALHATPQNYPVPQQAAFAGHIETARESGVLSGHFARFVSVRVNNEALLLSPAFRAAFQAFSPQGGIRVSAKLWADTGERWADVKRLAQSLPLFFKAQAQPLKNDKLPIYGHNFPVPGFPAFKT